MLATPVEILQNDVEFERLLDLYVERAPLAVLEVGTGEGGTLYHWLTKAQPGAIVVSIDDRHVNANLYPDWVPSGVTHVSIRGNSHDEAVADRARPYAPFDWVFIDADHHERDVRYDFAWYAAMASEEGLVALHDISANDDPNCEVDRFWATAYPHYAAKGQAFEIVEDGGFGIGVVVSPSTGGVFSDGVAR